MSIAEKLSYSHGRRDQDPNKDLAREISDSQDVKSLQKLVDFIKSKPHRRLQMDAILTIAWIGERNPKMLLPHENFLFEKLDDPIDRVGWGSMIALSNISALMPQKIYKQLPRILDAMDSGGIVGRDHGYQILIGLYTLDKYSDDLFFIVMEQIKKAPPNQLGQYTERLVSVLRAPHRKDLISTLEERREELSNEHHLKRLEKNLRKIYKGMKS